ncbi:hypothetical protein AB9F46_08690 [Rhizobium leguminosarum]|uniref:hypothetical protein n=1 Tax=Rhizobium leguminosarum TaxID=384 RepID=UPI00103D6CA2|nr:hypothetical protein [Rhizobium leguminosarum]MBY5784197.1 hypothetical protein [Rhizobium leguminosarum]NEH60115.1 hypothetical protein [Rhizobium leguminosarum]TBZ08073.1 hypothetical protein E0H38_29035 [Rhizobium leguminosarum bv. viciae]
MSIVDLFGCRETGTMRLELSIKGRVARRAKSVTASSDGSSLTVLIGQEVILPFSLLSRSMF